ncbi:MAG: septum formation initiator family protein [Nitrososphaerota archaeon]
MIKRKILNIVIILIGVLVVWFVARQVWQLYNAGKNLELAEARVRQLKSENQELKSQLNSVMDEEFVKNEAKEKLNFVEEGEVIVVLPAVNEVQKNNQSEKTQDISNLQKWVRALLF